MERKAAVIEYEDVDTIVTSCPPDDGWVEREFRGIDLSDERLNQRLIKTAGAFAKSPVSPINEASGNWAATQGSYRLFNNPKVTSEEILRPHQKETVKRMLRYGGTTLVLQDTVFFSYGKHPNTRDLGPIGKGESSTDRGLIMHNAFAVTTSGVPLGILSQRIWARPEVLDESKQEKIARLQLSSIDEKESSKWLLALQETRDLAPSSLKVVTIADRESDFFEFFTAAVANDEDRRAFFLIRAKTDRKLVPTESDDCTCITEALTGTRATGRLSVEIPSNGKRKKRVATVEIRFIEITLTPPQKRGKARNSGSSEPIAVTAISACEVNVPEGCEPISWVLLTNLKIKTHDDAVEKIEWYGRRWGIEIWHKAIKSGCKVEDCLLETGERLKRYLTLASIIGFRLLHITCLARTNPDAPCTDLLSAQEVEALSIRVTKKLPSQTKIPTLREAVRMIGGLGGHLGRKCDKEPGITTLWRGIMRLSEDVEMLSAYRAASDTS